MSKSGEPVVHEGGQSAETKSSKKNFNVLGQHCGRDLIKLNRKKLEDLISKIEGNELQKIGKQQIPEMMIQKCKDLRQKIDSRDEVTSSRSPGLHR